MGKKKLLLHSCCGPCSTAVIERLLEDGGYSVSVFYCNPNITDPEEYAHRKSEQIRFLAEINKQGAEVPFIDADYDPGSFLAVVKGLEEEPEGGARCSVCFELRLRRAAQYAAEHGFDCFDTTLTVSPYKNYDVISSIGRRISEETGVEYLSGNYKKKDGYRRSVELSRKYGLYRQHFCGCAFSLRDAQRKAAGSDGTGIPEEQNSPAASAAPEVQA
ncbi:MAG: epoxyqueuosine reductase QueH [Firmicutes bacterium]|nr:epoxyqueuosine reductase QueH [Bacillota bacterium]